MGEARRTFKPSLHIISQSLRDCSELVGFVNSTTRPLMGYQRVYVRMSMLTVFHTKSVQRFGDAYFGVGVEEGWIRSMTPSVHHNYDRVIPLANCSPSLSVLSMICISHQHHSLSRPFCFFFSRCFLWGDEPRNWRHWIGSRPQKQRVASAGCEVYVLVHARCLSHW